MVEMNEAASILNNMSSRSLVLLDEIGRGTSTYDGISIAWAMAEFIHEYPHGKAKTLFATHYHELNEMEKSFSRIKNYNVSVKELENKVIFLRKLIPGGSEHSFGIHVARMAGMPKSVVKRAGEIFSRTGKIDNKNSLSKPVSSLAEQREGYQLSIFQMDDPVLKQIREEISMLDINNLTPVEALNKLNEIKKIAGINKSNTLLLIRPVFFEKKKNELTLHHYAKIAQLVEHDLAKVGVAGSSPVFRSKSRVKLRDFFTQPRPGGGIGRHAGLKILWPLRPCGFNSRPGYSKPPVTIIATGYK
jgi:hypothetical protein